MEKLNIDTIKHMNCFMCKGDLENKNTTFMVELDITLL